MFRRARKGVTSILKDERIEKKERERKGIKKSKGQGGGPPRFLFPSPPRDFSSLSVMTMRYELGLWPLTRVSLRCGRLVWNARSRELLACTGWIVFIRSLISSTTRVGCSSSATFDRVHADLRAMLVSSNVRGCREEPGVLLLDYSNWILPRIDVTSLSFRPKMGREVVRFFLLSISLFSLSWILNIENRYWKYWLEIIEKIFLSLIKLPSKFWFRKGGVKIEKLKTYLPSVFD